MLHEWASVMMAIPQVGCFLTNKVSQHLPLFIRTIADCSKQMGHCSRRGGRMRTKTVPAQRKCGAVRLSRYDAKHCGP